MNVVEFDSSNNFFFRFIQKKTITKKQKELLKTYLKIYVGFIRRVKNKAETKKFKANDDLY
jgi:hypothetical protein